MQKKITPLVLSGFAESLNQRLPQYQCGRCGQPDCAHYAQALAAQQEKPDRCAPGGRALAEQLAAMCSVPLSADAVFDDEALQCARVVEEACIGCARCLRACPLDALIGAHKFLHAVLPMLCSGCGLCVPACPVDCIVLEPTSRKWSDDDAASARSRYRARLRRWADAAAARQGMEQTSEQAPSIETLEIQECAEIRKSVIADALTAARARRARYQEKRQKNSDEG